MRGYPVTLNQCESDVVYSQCRFEVTFLQCLFLRWNVVTEETTFSNWCLDLATCPSPSRPGRDDVTRLVSAVRRPPRRAPGPRRHRRHRRTAFIHWPGLATPAAAARRQRTNPHVDTLLLYLTLWMDQTSRQIFLFSPCTFTVGIFHAISFFCI